MTKEELLNYTKKYKKTTKRKLFIALVIITIISFIIGILFLAILDKTGKKIVYDTILDYTKNLTTSNTKSIFICFKNNVLIAIVMWILGISLFGIVFQIFFLISKSFITGFSLASFIYTFKVKGIFIGLIYIIPSVFNLALYFILSFFASNFSIYLFKYLFKNKEYNFKIIMKKYFKILAVVCILLIISSLIEVYVIPFILKLFTKSYF